MNKDIRIRMLHCDDYPAWVKFCDILSRFHYETMPDLWRRTPVPDQTPAELVARLDDPERRLFLATIDDTACGYIDCKMTRIVEGGRRIPRLSVHIHHLAVDIGYRGMGVAQRLIQSAESWAREIEASHLELTVFEGNDDALRLYEHVGFQTLVRTMQRPIGPSIL